MKKLVLTCLVAGALTCARAQLFTPESTTGAVLGGLAGAAIGGPHGHNAAVGAAIGAGAGLLLGAAAHEANEDRYYNGGGYYIAPYGGWYAPSYYAPSYSLSFGYGRPYWGRRYGYGFSVGVSAPLYYPPVRRYYASAPSYYAASPSYYPATAAAPPPAAAQNQYTPPAVTPMSSANSLFGR